MALTIMFIHAVGGGGYLWGDTPSTREQKPGRRHERARPPRQL